MGIQLTVVDEPDLTIPEDYPILARLLSAEGREWEFTDKKTGETKLGSNIEWVFEVIAEGIYKGRKVQGRTPVTISNRETNRTRLWAETLLGRPLAVGAAFNTDDLVGMACMITVFHQQDRKNKDVVWDRVDEILPPSAEFDPNNPPF